MDSSSALFMWVMWRVVEKVSVAIPEGYRWAAQGARDKDGSVYQKE